MRSEALLDSAVFQLTPTRTRCDLLVIANGKTEKIASGLLNPFLAHLKTAQDQIEKGGYSITLEPDPGTDSVWFTKNTVERFVRFVSTPEVLERVNTIESEILQIEEAIAIQGNDNLGVGTVDDHQTRSTDGSEGSKSMFNADAEKAIVLYKPGSHPPDSNGSTVQEENSKVQLLRVLETRKTVLQKEQGMAFARAVAAGFDIDHMPHLIAFAECFGASRLMGACLRFMELWKGKHETGQWLEIEAAEAMSSRSEFASLNTSGIILSSDTSRQKEFREAWAVSNDDLGSESNGKASNEINADLSSDHNRDKRADPQVPLPPHEYYQGQFQHPMFPQWPMHPPLGPAVFPPYHMQGMPYYQNYAGSRPFFQSPYPPTEDPRFNTTQRMGLKRHSVDSKDSNIESEAWEMGISSTRSQDSADQSMSEFEKEASQGRESHKKVGRSAKKKSGVVVIRNINYITSKRHNTSGSESRSASDSETEEETEDLHSDAPERKHKSSSRSLKTKGSHTKSIETSNSYEKDEAAYGQEAGSGHWQAFQSFLLRSEEENTSNADAGMFASEKEPPVKRKQNRSGADPILPPERDYGDVPEHGMAGFELVNGKPIRMKQAASNNELFYSSEGGLVDNQLDGQFKEIGGGGRGYRRAANDDFMIYGREKQLGSKVSLDPLAENEYEHAGNMDKGTSHNVTDESFIVPLRSGSQEQLGTDNRTAIDMDSEFPSSLQRTEDSSRTKHQLSYEPDDLSLMPERGMESESTGYDPAKDYDMQIHIEDAGQVENINQEDISTSTTDGLKKPDKEKKSRAAQDRLERRKMDATVRKGKPSKLNPLAEAQARAEKLRAFKADLQKEKKEKEEEEAKRLEALKRERQKRIAARGSSTTTQQQTNTRLPTKVSQSSYKGSKFSDSEPGTSSPLQKLPVRTASIGSNDSPKITKTSKLNGSIHLAGNGLSRSVSSLPELKKGTNGLMPEVKAASIRTKRLSDPKGSNIHHASSLKPVTNGQVPKRNVSNEPQMKKISAIIQLDKTKSATLPELRIRTSGGPSDIVQKKSATKEAVQKGSANKTSLTSEGIRAKRTIEKATRSSDSDDNPVIEKSVVMLENEMVSAPVVLASEETIEIKDGSYIDNRRGKTQVVSEYAAIRAPPSPVISGEVDDPNACKLDEQLNQYEAVIDYQKDESQNFSGSTVTEKPYQAPYARTSSLEDPSASNFEFTEAPKVISQTVRTGSENIKAHVSSFGDSNLAEHIHETNEKPRSKESSKGFRKLLKFGRKSHSSVPNERNLDSDCSSVDDHTVAGTSSNEVHTLKNLISEDDTHIGGTPPKVSRPFSLLSPFRTKSNEKKLAA